MVSYNRHTQPGTLVHACSHTHRWRTRTYAHTHRRTHALHSRALTCIPHVLTRVHTVNTCTRTGRGQLQSGANFATLLLSFSTKSSRQDFIPTSLIKSCSSVFSELISTLANLSFSEGTFPSRFKLALVSPLIKKHGLDKDAKSNYRPIFNLNNISKILERLLLARVQDHIISSTNFNPFQSTYRKYNSTETAVASYPRQYFPLN